MSRCSDISKLFSHIPPHCHSYILNPHHVTALLQVNNCGGLRQNSSCLCIQAIACSCMGPTEPSKTTEVLQVSGSGITSSYVICHLSAPVEELASLDTAPWDNQTRMPILASSSSSHSTVTCRPLCTDIPTGNLPTH